jgi:predicted GIY-YIG superfamily endonuclease
MNQQEETYCLYYFADENNEPYYIGQTKRFEIRKQEHLRGIKNNFKFPKYRKVRKLIKKGIPFKMKILEDNITKETINNTEIKAIKAFKEVGFKLYNVTEGGDFCPSRKGVKLSKETRMKISKNRKGIVPNIRFPEERNRKISEAKKGLKFSEEHKKNLSVARRKRTISKATRLKTSKTSKGKINIKTFKLFDPNGNIHITKQGLSKFCEEHNLTSHNLHKVLTGHRPHHKGWRIERYDN